MMPTQAKSAPVVRPWFSIWMTEPSMPVAFIAKMPRAMNPMWLTELYATNRLTSVCASAARAPYRMPTTAIVASKGNRICPPSGVIPMLNRRNP